MGKNIDKPKNRGNGLLDGLNSPSLPKEFILKSVRDSNINSHIVTHFYPKSPISEQYRRLRENIRSLNKQHNMKVFAMTSSNVGEGKTLTSLNLAVTMTHNFDCKNVLIIDGDLRRGNIDSALGMNSQVGLSEYLLLGADIDNIIFKTKIEKLSIIPRGKIAENPAELLSSDKMAALMTELRKRFDYIIVDAPPVIPVADPAIISGLADGVIMVIRAGKTQSGIVKHATELLEQSKANLLGYILTHVEYYIPHYIYKYV